MKKVFIFLFACFIVSFSFGEDFKSSSVYVENERQIISTEKEYSHTQVALTGYIPYFGTYLLSASQLLLPQNFVQQSICLESLLLNIPASIVNPVYTLTGSAITTGSWVSGMILENHQNIYGNPSLAYTFENVGFKGNMWLQYKGYEKARSSCSSDFYKEYETLSFKDAVLACYDPKILSKKSVWIPVLSLTALNAGFSMLGGFDQLS